MQAKRGKVVEASSRSFKVVEASEERLGGGGKLSELPRQESERQGGGGKLSELPRQAGNKAVGLEAGSREGSSVTLLRQASSVTLLYPPLLSTLSERESE